MAKAIQFVAGDVKFSATLTKVDRDKIYGFVEQIVKVEIIGTFLVLESNNMR